MGYFTTGASRGSCLLNRGAFYASIARYYKAVLKFHVNLSSALHNCNIICGWYGEGGGHAGVCSRLKDASRIQNFAAAADIDAGNVQGEAQNGFEFA